MAGMQVTMKRHLSTGWALSHCWDGRNTLGGVAPKVNQAVAPVSLNEIGALRM